MAAAENVPHAFVLFFGKVIQLEQLAEAEDRIQRCAQLMAHPGEELAFRSVGAVRLLLRGL